MNFFGNQILIIGAQHKFSNLKHTKIVVGVRKKNTFITRRPHKIQQHWSPKLLMYLSAKNRKIDQMIALVFTNHCLLRGDIKLQFYFQCPLRTCTWQWPTQNVCYESVRRAKKVPTWRGTGKAYIEQKKQNLTGQVKRWIL